MAKKITPFSDGPVRGKRARPRARRRPIVASWGRDSIMVIGHASTLGPSRPKVLYLTHRVPYPPDKGDRIRNYHILTWLAARASVHLACLADEGEDDGKVGTLRGLADRVGVIRPGGDRGGCVPPGRSRRGAP